MERKPKVILLQERKRRGWTQQQLAEALNAIPSAGEEYGAATYKMVSTWEQGIHLPSPFYVARLCTIFGCTADQLGLGVRPEAPTLNAEPLAELAEASPALRLMRLITVIDHWRAWLHDLQALVWQETQHMDKLSRRETLLALVALPGALLMLKEAPPLEEELARYAASIAACWSLYYEGGMEEVRPYLALHLPRLSSLAKTPSRHQQSAASLASQAYQLDWMVALHDQNFGHALYASQEAVLYGEIACNLNLIVASQIRRAYVYFHLKNPTQQLRYHEAALQCSANVSPLLKSWLNMSVAENYASLHQTKEAERLLDLARKQFSDHSEEDSVISYVQVTQYRLSIWEARTSLRLAQPQEALDSIRRVEQDIPDALVPQRVELLNQRLMALCELGEMEEVCTLLEVAERGSRLSRLRYNEVGEVYAVMRQRWPTEQKVLELETLLHR